jgi:hypothetical protein
MTPKQAALTATIVVLAIAGYCTWIALSSRETGLKIIGGTVLVACAFIACMVIFIIAMKSGNENLND